MSQEKRNYSAIIFDMDGVLFDSEPLHAEAWQESLESVGIKYDNVFFTQWIGIPDEDLALFIDNDYPCDGGMEIYLERKRKSFRQLVRRKLKPFFGINEWLHNLAKIAPIAIATSSGRADMKLMLEVTNLTTYFSASSTHEDVSMHKPNPEPYLFAAKKLGVDPQMCIAIDDSPTGIASAKEAGMLTFGITSSFPADKLKMAEMLFADTSSSCQWIMGRYFSGDRQ